MSLLEALPHPISIVAENGPRKSTEEIFHLLPGSCLSSAQRSQALEVSLLWGKPSSSRIYPYIAHGLQSLSSVDGLGIELNRTGQRGAPLPG